MKNSLDIVCKTTALCLVLNLGSCSSWWSHREGVVSEEDKKKELATTVSRKQYDELLARYEALLRAQENQTGQQQLPVGQNLSDNSDGSLQLLEALSKTPQDKNLMPPIAEKKAEPGKVANVLPSTVALYEDIDNSTPIKTKVPPSVTGKTIATTSQDEIENDLLILQAAESLVAKKDWNMASEKLTEIENSPVWEIRARALFFTGEMYFARQQFDLALQTFENLIKQYASSGVIPQVLGRLVVCSERLNLKEKREKYFSLLNDFFQKA